MIKPKISIIIPIYNAEKYLNRCINSILKQDFQDFEILLIDDGSTDKSYTICKQYSQKDFRIKIFSKKNGGVSSARNLGLLNAKGEYILFIDADDTIDKTLISANIKYLTSSSHYDLIEIPAIYNYLSNEEYKSANKGKIILGNKACIKYISTCKRYEVWSFIFKTEILKDIRFKEHIKIGEDIIFLYEVISKVSSIVVSNYGFYFHYKNDDSAMNTLTSKDRTKTDIILISELQNTTVNYRHVLITFTIEKYKDIFYKKQINKEMNKLLIKILQDISLKDILNAPISCKRKIMLSYLFFFYQKVSPLHEIYTI